MAICIKKISGLIQRLFSGRVSKKKHKELFDKSLVISYFAFAGHKDVEGWLSAHTLSLVHFIDQFQDENNIEGNVIEIGVFHGRFFIALCLLLRMGEKALAIDVFEDQQFNLDGAGVGDYGIFSKNLQIKLGCTENIDILKSDSLKLNSTQLLRKLGVRKSRMFSIDGCHTAQHTENDLFLAADAITPGGVIIVDDFENPTWPGVLEGIKQFLQKRGDIIPIIISYNKLYLTNVEFRDSYREYLEKIVARQTDKPEYIQVFGNDVLRALMPIPETLFPAEYQKIIDFSSFSAAPRKFLLSGWSFSEPWGVWTDGCRAEIEIDLPENRKDDLCMVIAFHLFVTETHPEAKISIQVGSGPADVVSFCYGQEYQTWLYALTADKVADKRQLKILFVISEPKSPKELGLSDDTRYLGVGLRAIYFLK